MAKVERRSTWWFWVLGVVMVVVGYSLVVAISTHDTACGYPEAPKDWRVFPPGWECRTGF